MCEPMVDLKSVLNCAPCVCVCLCESLSVNTSCFLINAVFTLTVATVSIRREYETLFIQNLLQTGQK